MAQTVRGPRPESLRTEQRRLARERILAATAEVIVADGLMNLSLPAVAERAGVSLRTVYNYFETKDGLVESLSEHVVAEMVERGGRDVETDATALPDAIRTNWRLFDAAGTKGLALGRILGEHIARGGHATDSGQSRARTAGLRVGLAELRPDLTDDQLDAVTALVRLHVSFHSWYRLTQEFGVDSETAGRLSAWAFEVMRDALASGRGPFDPPSGQRP